MAEALRALKDIVEQIAGIRQDESAGSPLIWYEPVPPRDKVGRNLIKLGDFWIDSQTKKLYFWDDVQWVAVVPGP